MMHPPSPSLVALSTLRNGDVDQSEMVDSAPESLKPWGGTMANVFPVNIATR